MKNQKVGTGLGAIVLVIIAITVGAFALKIIKDREVEEAPQSSINSKIQKTEKVPQNIVAQPKPVENSAENKEFSVSENWTLVSHENFWNNPKFFASSNYRFPNIQFSYPDNWKFSCCNDVDYGSTHIIFSKENDTSLPYIKITNYTLNGCPGKEQTCAIDKAVKITADQKYKILTSSISSNNILPKLKIESLNVDAFAYNKNVDSESSRSYLINLSNAVIEIDFVNYELLNEDFIANFLNHISFENKN